MDLESKWGFELEGFAVDAGEGLPGSRADFKPLRRELVPVPASTTLPEGGEGDYLGCLPTRRRRDGDDAQLPRIQATALRRVQGRAQHVRIVRYLDEKRTVHFPAVGLGELEVERLLCPTEHVGEQRFRGLRLRLAVTGLLHDRRVDPE